MFWRKGLAAAATAAVAAVGAGGAAPTPLPSPSTQEFCLQADSLKVTRLGGAANHDDESHKTGGFSVGTVCSLGVNGANGRIPPGTENVVVLLGANHRPAAYNSVVHLPGLVTKEECKILRDAADSRSNELEVHTLMNPDFPVDGVRGRIPVREMGQRARSLSDDIIRSRLLPRMQAELPGVAEAMLKNNNKPLLDGSLRECEFNFSGKEPSINRYESGDAFAPHTDDYDITVNILLSDPGAFSGAGTAFYTQNEQGTKDADPSVHIEPQQGAAVVFNGQVWHEGLAVTEGTRHLYVASFEIV